MAPGSLLPSVLLSCRGNLNMEFSIPSNPERFSAVPLPFGRVLGLVPLYCSFPFKPWLFFYAIEQTDLLTVPLPSLPTVVCSVGVQGSLHYHVSISLVLYVVSVFCCVEAIQSVLPSSSGGITL